MSHGIRTYEGPARHWYRSLVDQVLAEHDEIPCRQGLALESPHSLSAILPGAHDPAAAFATIDLPRRGDSRARTTFSVLHALRRILGYHETVLFDRYPILARYTSPMQKKYFARSIAYLRESLPSSILTEPWVTRVETASGTQYAVDQVLRAACLLAASPTTRRAFVDFGEGFTPRCMLSWLFLIRKGSLRLHQEMRSNDLVVGMPNDLIDGRTSQIVMAAITGTAIGEMHHHASIIQIYRRDIAGVDTVSELSRMDFSEVPLHIIESRMRSTPIVVELTELVAPWIGRPLQEPDEVIQRWRTVMDGIETLFWRHNSSCSAENRRCIEHLIGRYRQ